MSADNLPQNIRAATTPLAHATVRLSLAREGLDPEQITGLLGVEPCSLGEGTWRWELSGRRAPEALLTELMSTLPGPASPLWIELNTRYTVQLTILTPAEQNFSLGNTLLAEVARMTRRIHFETSPR
jgi:hypothetical protein